MMKVENTTAGGGEHRGDARNNWVSSRHHRVWMCDACDLAPAAFLCKADSASLCAACDSDIHSANPLARRHHRVPIPPSQGTFFGHSDPGFAIGPPTDDDDFLTHDDGEDEDEAASWLLLNPVKNEDGRSHDDGPPLFAGAAPADEYLDLDDYNSSCQNINNNNNQFVHQDSVVPIQYHEQKEHSFHHLGLDYESSNNGYSCYPTSMSSSHNNVSVSTVDVGVVPESTMSEGSIFSAQYYQRPTKGTVDLFSGQAAAPPPTPTQLSPMDREARVMRYREKKKMRRFEKTIRYASRKAYAETRPRIKGRFAKRSVSCAS